MTRVVQKYGGSSVATPMKLRRVARRIRESLGAGTQIVVVVSAMGDTTDELIALAHRITGDPPSREMDMLLSSGETITAPLLAMALHAAGTPAISLTGAQAGIRTSSAHRTARIVDIVPQRVLDELERGNVVVVAGCHGGYGRHHARPRGFGHDGRRARRGHSRRPLRDLHRCSRRAHGRSAHRS